MRLTSHSWYVLVVLTMVYAFNWMDRYIFVILMEPLKRDLGISDTALGFLSGFAFSAVYTIAGIPIARIVDAFVHDLRSTIIPCRANGGLEGRAARCPERE